MNNQSVILAITGASGVIYGVRMLEALKAVNIEVHLIISRAALITISTELDFTTPKQLIAAADFYYQPENIAASIASGSFCGGDMVIAPCSVKTLAAIAYCQASDLITRAADVTLKEKRRLILMLRETPLHLGHLKAMVAASEMGAIINPISPAFYNKPKTIDDLVNHQIARTLDLLDIKSDNVKRWNGI